MVELISEFWKWLEMSQWEYMLMVEEQRLASCAVDFEEYMFPLWNELLDEVREDISNEKIESGSIDKVLTVMALDNENEDILDYITANASNKYVAKLVQRGVHCPYFHARWQIAEILGRRFPYDWEKLLEVLSKDPNSYVSKRASNILETVIIKSDC